MKHPLFVTCLAVFLALAAPVAAQAQSARAYAPENLRQLSVPDRVRVIEREYADQSRGRQIPDDQLEFYLAQVDSGWGFSRIKQDIATSLRGSGGTWRPNPGWSSQTVTCSSNDRRRRQCQTPFRGRAVLVENISGTRCVEGQNWGSGSGFIWVDQGCRGRFAEGRGWGGSGGGGNGGILRCESQDNRERICPAGGWRGATLVRQLSKTRCVEGQNWGVRNGAIWVRSGCRGEFAESRGGGWGGGNSNYSVTCSSDNNRPRTCAWDRRQGRPVVIQQISKNACIEGRTWGLDGNAIWVNGGCRARFGAR